MSFAFLSSEQKNNFTRALERFIDLFMTSEGDPHVIINDRDPTLINVIDNVFPKFISCYVASTFWKMSKPSENVNGSIEAWDMVMEAWENVMDCEQESMFGEYVDHLQ